MAGAAGEVSLVQLLRCFGVLEVPMFCVYMLFVIILYAAIGVAPHIRGAALLVFVNGLRMAVVVVGPSVASRLRVPDAKCQTAVGMLCGMLSFAIFFLMSCTALSPRMLGVIREDAPKFAIVLVLLAANTAFSFLWLVSLGIQPQDSQEPRARDSNFIYLPTRFGRSSAVHTRDCRPRPEVTSFVLPETAAAGAGPHPHCTICLDECVPGCMMGRLPCGHSFHDDCVRKWLKTKHAQCPMRCPTAALDPPQSTPASEDAVAVESRDEVEPIIEV